jgi:hypothetical protein
VAKIEYVGKKPIQPDCVAGTGIVWNGAGDIQEVNDPIAIAKLLEHTDSWRLVDGEKAAEAIEAARVATLAQRKGIYDQDEEDEVVAARVDVNRLAKEPLVQYAKRTFNLDLDRGKTLVQLRTEVAEAQKREAMAGRNPRGEDPRAHAGKASTPQKSKAPPVRRSSKKR